ncbi:hypothetical protein GJV85_11000 [Sulfurimonas aquatica]|uniref:Uncharacterized protein n=1 Tax=Sulfurimonas aquatica TaxID=2672570 RepID=A0A975B1Q2_9BACT|nr:hypothetical protein [Sulfurimonas aquatica]QSZ42612.1 hypothetical protein GJV85_11000 [Sulfurimonas aquatica]
MAIDNSLYDSLENTYIKIKEYFDNTQLGREHSTMIIKHEELSELLETFDIEALEEQSNDINSLHKQLDDIKEISTNIVENLNNKVDSISTADKVVSGLDKVFTKITKLVL